MSRDFAFVVAESVSVGDLMKAVKSGAGPLLSDMRVFDVYQGANIEAGQKSVAITVTLSPTKATLTDEEIEKISDSIITVAGKNFAATLR